MPPNAAVPTLLLALTLLLGACGPEDLSLRDAEGVPAEERYGGTAVVGIQADLQTMNAFVASDARSVNVQQYMLLMPLVRFDERLDAHPRLAERWDTVAVGTDSLDLTFHLRSDVRWHDGEPTTAEDVRFTFERATDPRTGYPNLSLFEDWSREVEVPDPHTIRFRLRRHADYMTVWAIGIMPAHLLADVPPEEIFQHPYGTSRPVGNGPFRFLRRVPGQEWVFASNPDFPRELGGAPYLDRVVFRIVPDQTTLMTELITGGIDAYVPSPAHMERLEGTRGVRTLSSPFRTWTYIGWNTLDPLFGDARVRRAISLALDRQALADAVLHGYGDIGISSSTPGHWVYDDAYEELAETRDLDRARRLLAEAGWTPDRAGSLRNTRGDEFRFVLISNQGSEVAREVGQVVQAQLRPLGIAVEPRGLEWNTLVQILDGTRLPGGGRQRDFQAVTSQWQDGFRKDDAAIFHSRNRDGPFAETGFSSPRTDLLIDTLRVLIDREVARPLWQEYHRLLLHEAPYAVLFYPHALLAHRESLNGVVLDIRGDLATVTGWWIHPEARRRSGTAGGPP